MPKIVPILERFSKSIFVPIWNENKINFRSNLERAHERAESEFIMNNNTIKNVITETKVLSKKEEKAILFQNNITETRNAIVKTDNGFSLDNVNMTEKDFEFKEDGFKDLTTYTNLNNPVLEKQIAKIQKYRADIRLSLVNIGGVLFDIRNSGSYKKSLKDLGIKSKDFAVFCKEFFGLPKTTTYRYIGVYTMAADITGKVDNRIALLSNSQLYALYGAKVSHDDIIALLDKIDGVNDIKELETAINDGVKALTTTETSETTETPETTENGIDIHKPIEDSIMYKCTIKNSTPIFIPKSALTSHEIWNDITNYIMNETTYNFPNCKHNEIQIAVAYTETADFIIISDNTNKNILTYYHKRKTETTEN